jgi:hypothetical protein
VQQRPHRLRRLLDMHRLGREDREVAGAGVRRVRCGVDAHGAIARGALEAKAVGPYRVDMCLPAVDGPDLVSRIAEQRRVDASHRTATYNRNLHDVTPAHEMRRF